MILMVLKIIGIAIAVLLAVVVLLLCVVLFDPIEYRVTGAKNETNEWLLRCSWIFRMLKLNYAVNAAGRQMSLKLLGFTLSDSSKKKPPKKKSLGSRRRLRVKKKPKKKATTAKGKLKRIINKSRELFGDENFSDFMKHSYRLLVKLIKTILPKNLRAKVEFGLKDPADTGKAIGAISIVRGVLGNREVAIVGNFEKEVFLYNVSAYGKLRLFAIIMPIITYVFKKPVWRIIKRYILQ